MENKYNKQYKTIYIYMYTYDVCVYIEILISLFTLKNKYDDWMDDQRWFLIRFGWLTNKILARDDDDDSKMVKKERKKEKWEKMKNYV